MVSLTFDDGPDERWTPPVLDALERAAVQATFFVVAEQMAEPVGPDLLQAIASAGHRVEAHCSRHRPHDEQDRAELALDVAGLLAAIETQALPRPSIWRPPYGRISRPASFELAEENGLQLVLWTADPRDYRDTPAEAMLDHLAPALYEDSVILLHDSRRYASTSDSAANTVALIGPLVEEVRRRGFELGPLEHPVTGRELRPGEDEPLVPSPEFSD
ncbi:MAG TPA: polysaccharide deacetylase family protein [Solirubrobacteraceae bacterium]|jgi:peptidoglycan/xylan/chitin deacetylase (PgdA/CDA1 family)|nr:polysaccharide deacetylase family protein [Solirubrobacteraceae bacterium]